MNQLSKQIFVLILIIIAFSCNVRNKKNDEKGAQVPLVIDEKSKKHKPEVVKGIEIFSSDYEKVITSEIKKKYGINFDIFKVYLYKDMSGKHYMVFTENYIEKKKAKKIVDKIKLFNLIENEFGEILLDWSMNDFIIDSENSIWFWTKYLSLEDLDGDGIVEPIIVYGSSTPLSFLDYGRSKILIYYKGVKVAIRHQNCDLDDGRHTNIPIEFFSLPKDIQRFVFQKMKLIQDNRHSLFNLETFRKIEDSINQ